MRRSPHRVHAMSDTGSDRVAPTTKWPESLPSVPSPWRPHPVEGMHDPEPGWIATGLRKRKPKAPASAVEGNSGHQVEALVLCPGPEDGPPHLRREARPYERPGANPSDGRQQGRHEHTSAGADPRLEDCTVNRRCRPTPPGNHGCVIGGERSDGSKRRRWCSSAGRSPCPRG